MSNVVESETKELHHELPLMQSFIALLVITVIELIISEIDTDTLSDQIATTLLLLLTVAKAVIVGAVFMEIAYDKDVKSIITYVFIIPMIAVSFLIFTIIADWR